MTANPGRIIGVGLLVCLASACMAQQVSFISPQNGATVRGIMDLHATKPNPGEGWISYKIGQAGQEGNYIAAVITPFTYKWDTRQHTAEGERVYADGDYIVTATAFDSSANQMGEATATITLQNELTPAEVEEPVMLRTSYERAGKLDFAADGKMTVTLPEEEKKKLGVPLRLDIVVKAAWGETVLSAAAGGEAVLDKTLRSGFIQVAGAEGYQLPGAGQTFRERVQPDGVIDPFRPKDPHFALGEYYVKLPDRPVSRGETWTSELSVLPLPNAVNRQTLQAQNKLDGYEYVAGRKCARIVTTFSQKDVLVMVRVGSSVLPIKTSYDARRASYFGLSDHHFVGFEEKMRHTMVVPVQAIQMLWQLQTAMAAKGQPTGGMGVPGAGGMGMPAAGGMGGMPGGGMVGGPGKMGMGGEGGGMTPGGFGAPAGGMMGGGGYGAPAGGMMGGGGTGAPGMGGMGGMGGATAAPQMAKIVIDSELRIMESAAAGKKK